MHLIRALDKKIDDVVGTLSRKVEHLEHLYYVRQQQNSTALHPWSFDHDTEEHDDESMSSQGDHVEEKKDSEPSTVPEEVAEAIKEEAGDAEDEQDQHSPMISQATRSPEVLREAIRLGDLTTVYCCLEDNHVSPNHLYRGCVTPLHFSVGNNQKSIVTTLLSRGADVNAYDEKKRTPLHGAAMLGYESIASLLLARGARTDVLTEFGETPLACAAATGNIALINILLDKGASVDYCDIDTRRTPLFVAAMHGHVEVISLLLEKGAAIHKAEGWNETCEDALSEGIQRMVDRGANLQIRSALLVPEEHKEVKDLLKRLQSLVPQQQSPSTANGLLETPGSSFATERSSFASSPPFPSDLPLQLSRSPDTAAATAATTFNKSIPTKTQWVAVDQGRGVAVAGVVAQGDGHPVLLLDITNTLSVPAFAFAIKFEPNSFGLAPRNMQFDLPRPIRSGETIEAVVHLKFDPMMVKKNEEEYSNKRDAIGLEIKAAMKNMTTSQFFRFTFPVVVPAICTPGPTINPRDFLLFWNDMNLRMVATGLVRDVPTIETNAIKAKLGVFGVSLVNAREMPGINKINARKELLFSWTVVGHACLIEVRTETSRKHTCTLTVKSFDEAFSAMSYVLLSKRLRLPESE